MRRVGVVLASFAVAAGLSACASVGHTWQDEFTARLEGAAGSIEEARRELRAEMSEADYFRLLFPLGHTLEFKAALIEELDPPAGCEEVQEKGEHAVRQLGAGIYSVPKNMTPYLERHLPTHLKEEVAALGMLKREAQRCATG